MNVSNRALGSDLAKIDAHVITPEEYEEIPELTDEFFEEADEYIGDKLIRRGRRAGSGTKVSTTVRFDAPVIEAFRATGKGWQTRMNNALVDWLKTHSPASA
ncbi:MAG: BrnA antitoxin family protein [Magnetococcales bacterium]|nr:BrnA antitoxin family protein [Magnetococcales bacterium]